jgi:hypothetical protein
MTDQISMIPNDAETIAKRSAWFAKMLADLNDLVNGSYNSNYTARGQNLRPLIKSTMEFAMTILPADSPDRIVCQQRLKAWLEDEGKATTPKQRKENK